MAEIDKSSPFYQDESGRTSLFYAVEKGDLATVRKIIFRLTGTGLFPQRLALLSKKDNEGKTAADVAKENGFEEIYDLLRGEELRMEHFE